MVAEHRPGPGRRIRFDDEPPPRPDAGSEPSSRWTQRFRDTLSRLGVDVPDSADSADSAAGARVADLAVRPGEITATVDDGAVRVRIGCRALPDEVWDDVVAALAADPWSAATVLEGRLPDTPADELFLLAPSEVPLDCSCADWAMPCAHVRAVAAAAADLVATDPFVLTCWRGRDRAAVQDAVRAVRTGGAGPDPRALPVVGFHRAGAPLPTVAGAAPGRPDALLDELPPLGTALSPDGVTDAREALRPLYRRLPGDQRLPGD